MSGGQGKDEGGKEGKGMSGDQVIQNVGPNYVPAIHASTHSLPFASLPFLLHPFLGLQSSYISSEKAFKEIVSPLHRN